MKDNFFTSEETGRVLKVRAKGLLSLAGSEVPQFHSASIFEEVSRVAGGLDDPVVDKVVSPTDIPR
jgi:hypothetical protein